MLLEMWQKLRTQILSNGLLEFGRVIVYLSIPCFYELMKLVGSHGSLLLLFIMKVMLSEFMIDSHKVYNTLIDVFCFMLCIIHSIAVQYSFPKMLGFACIPMWVYFSLLENHN